MVQYASLLLACLIGSAAASNGAASNKQVSDDGTLHCGIFASGNKDKVSDLELELRGGQAGKSWTIGPGQCNRVHCADTTGVYVCNVCILWPLLSVIIRTRNPPPFSPPKKSKNQKEKPPSSSLSLLYVAKERGRESQRD